MFRRNGGLQHGGFPGLDEKANVEANSASCNHHLILVNVGNSPLFNSANLHNYR